MIKHRTPLDRQVIRYPRAPRFTEMYGAVADTDIPIKIEEYQFVPQPAVAVQCMRCGYLSGNVVLLYTREEVDDHVDMHNLMDTK